jgi:putative endonuclease
MYRERKTYYVYIMGSLSGTLYIGMTSKLHTRTFEHKFHRLEGFTDKYHVERLLYWESFDLVHRAIGREKQLKGWRRSKKIALIESINPHWLDLAREWFPSMTSPGESRGASTTQDDPLRESSCSAQHDKNEESRKEEK